MYCKTITKEIFDSYIANDSDTVLEGVVTNAFEGTAFRRFVRVPLAKGEHYVEALYEQDFGSFILENIHIKGPDFIDWWTVVEVPTTEEENQ